MKTTDYHDMEVKDAVARFPLKGTVTLNQLESSMVAKALSCYLSVLKMAAEKFEEEDLSTVESIMDGIVEKLEGVKHV